MGGGGSKKHRMAFPFLCCLVKCGYFFDFRVATGENWPNIMLACRKDAKCDPSLPAVKQQGIIYCGTDVTYFYFISFVFFCSFLVSQYLICNALYRTSSQNLTHQYLSIKSPGLACGFYFPGLACGFYFLINEI